MISKLKLKNLYIFLVFVLIVGALFPPVAIASAQDEAPPATEETVTETDENPVDEAGEATTSTEEAPAESAPEAEAPVEEPAAVSEPSDEASEEPASTETLTEVVQAMAESDAILVDAEGEEIPLASQEAVEVLSNAKDPWFTANDGSGIVVGYTNIGGTCDISVTECNPVANPVQAAIADDRSTGQVVKILAGSYDEEVTINKSITFEGVADGSFVDAVIRSIILNVDISGWTNVFGQQVLVNSGAHIQDGIDVVQAGGTVSVAPGTYEEEAVDRTANGGGNYQFGLYVGKDKNGITVQGVKADGTPVGSYGEAAALIKTNATNTFGTSGIFVEGDNVTFNGLMVGDNKIGNNKTFEILGDNFTLKNSQIVVSDGGSVYIGDWNFDPIANTSYIKSYTIEGNLFANGASLDISNGAGYSGSMANRLIVDNVFDGKMLDGSNAPWALTSFNGNVPAVGWFVYPVGGATIAGNSYSNGDMYIRSRGTVDDSSFDWKSYWENNTFDHAAITLEDLDTFDVREFSYASGAATISNVRLIGNSIQKQVDIAQNGDIVLASPGTFIEQIQIIGKNINLLGNNTIIQSPDTLVQLGRTGLKPVVYVNGATNVIIDGFTIDGANKGSANNKFVGVEFYNAGGTLQNSKIINVMDTAFSGVQHGVGLYAWNDAGVNTTLKVLNNQIYDFQKNATAFFGSDLVLDIENNTIIGAGPTSVTAQNGIQITDATGIVKNNTVSGINYTGSGWVASAFLLTNTPNLQVLDNSISGSNVGIYANRTNSAVLQGNTISQNDYGVYSAFSNNLSVMDNIISENGYGILAFQSSSLQITGNTISGNDYGYWDDGSIDPLIDSNIVDNNTYGLIFYPYYYPSVGPYNPTITNNVISNNFSGLGFYGDIAGAVANRNKFINNVYQLESYNGFKVNALDNWWGDNSGPWGVTGLVDASTWLQLGLDANPVTINPRWSSNLTSFMYSSGDAARTPITDLWWFNPIDVVNTELTSLGSMAGNVFIAGLNDGTAFFSSTYDGATNDNLAFVRIVTPPDPDDDGGAVAPPVVPFIPGVIPVTGGVIPVTGGMNQLSCTEANTLLLASGNSVSFSAPLCGFDAGLTEESGGALPAPLPGGMTFVAGMTLSLQKDGTAFSLIPEPVTNTVSFAIPEDLKGKTFVILFWDAEANGGLGSWVEVPSTAPGQATITYSGTFVLAYL